MICTGTPGSITQFPEIESHIQWLSPYGSATIDPGQIIRTGRDLKNINIRDFQSIIDKTWYLILSDWQYDVTPISTTPQTIQIFLKTIRRGRIIDDTVGLTMNSIPINQNNLIQTKSPIADNFLPSDEYVYGGDVNSWGISEAYSVLDPGFGIILRFQSHPDFPHSDPMKVISANLILGFT